MTETPHPPTNPRAVANDPDLIAAVRAQLTAPGGPALPTEIRHLTKTVRRLRAKLHDANAEAASLRWKTKTLQQHGYPTTEAEIDSALADAYDLGLKSAMYPSNPPQSNPWRKEPTDG